MKKKYSLLTVTFLFSFLGFSIGKPILPHNPILLDAPLVYPDMDEDGFFSMIGVSVLNLDISIPRQSTIGNDCNDLDPEYHPGAVYYRDGDGDGYGDLTLTITACEDITGYVLINGDCNDQNALINPDIYWYRDYDGDGYGDIAYPYINNPQCQQPQGYVLDHTDCNDNINSVHQVESWYADTDGDGYGSGTPTSACGSPVGGYVNNNFDTCPTVSGPYEGCQMPNSTIAYGGGKKNYIISIIPKVPVTSTQNITHSYDANVKITYFDGLGRPNQQIASAQSGTGKNLITPIEYDAFGRQVKEYLPYAITASGLDYVNTAINDQANFNQYLGQVSYSEKLFEASPLNRVIEQAAPGNDWSLNNGTKHTIRLDYRTNTTTDAVKLFSITATWDAVKGLYDIPTSLTATTYADFQLYKTITKNENWITADGNNKTIEEFKDKEGRLVLKRTYDNNIAHNTYYVYDQYGNLTYVIPPLVDTTIILSSSVLDGLCYQYRYDYRNRLVEKKLPGKQWEFIVYDRLNRVVATGPAFAPFSDLLLAPAKIGWMITKYDAFNRPTYTGWQQATSIATADRKLLQDAQNALSTTLNETKTTSGTIDGVSVYYSNAVAPTSFKLLTVNYYDDYSFPNAPTTIPAYVMNDNSQPVFYNASTKPKGLPTGTWVRIPELSTTTPVKSETNYVLYDNKARAVRSATTNYLTGYTQVDSKIDFEGKVLYTETKHKRLSTDPIELFVKEAYTYSVQGRLLTHTHQIGTAGTPQLIAKNTYNELGQLITKNVGGTNTTSTAIGLQKVDYSYNIRGWLKGINDVTDLKTSTENDLFAFKLNYNVVDNAPNSNCKALFNGNISETYWRTYSDNIKRKYSFEYDNLNRLKNAIYQKPDMAIAPTNSYNESLQYDKNGNIVALQRNGDYDDALYPLQIDNLNYSYDTTNNTPNKLLKVTDLTNDPTGFKDGTNTNDDFGYDANGNMTSDQNKGITSIKYNHLNLPTEIIFNNLATKKITYLYDSNGTKKQKVFTNGTVVTTTDYLNGFQYTKTGSAAVLLKYFPTSEGYVSVTVSGGVNIYNYVYNYTDHLGNVRVSYGYGANKSGVYGTYILQENNYYPFGLSHTNYNTTKLVYEDNLANGIAGTLAVPQLNYTLNKYKYNGKELQEELGLNMYDYGARNYDPALGRWMNIDPLAEKATDWTPYRYAFNNPLSFTDPTGMYEDWVEKENGDIYWDDNATSQATTKEGETYRGKSYQRDKIWNNVNVGGNIENGLMAESYNSNAKMTYENKTPWMDKAFEEMAKNISETGNNPQITKYWAYTQMPAAAANGDKWAQSVLKEDQTPWCAAFVNYNLGTSGVEGTKSALAYSFKGYGQDLGNDKPIYGSIAVMNYSHVGFVAGTNKDGRVILLGGNQGNAVNLSPNSTSSVIKYVYPSSTTSSSLALPQYNLSGRSLSNATSR